MQISKENVNSYAMDDINSFNAMGSAAGCSCSSTCGSCCCCCCCSAASPSEE